MSSKSFTDRGIAGALTLFALATCLCPTGCPAKSVELFAFEKTVGFWYVIATSAGNGENWYRCATLNVTQAGKNIEATFTGVSTLSGKLKTYLGSIRPAGYMQAWWWAEYEGFENSGSLDHTIIKTGKSVIIILDRIKNHGHPLRKTGIILSQTEKLHPEELKSLKEKFYPDFQSSQIHDIDQFDCEPYRYSK